MRQFLAMIMIVCLTNWIAAQEPVIPKWSPSTDLQAMQGEWRLDPERSFFATDTAFDSIVKEPKRQLSSVRVTGNSLHLSDGAQVVVTNDLRIAGVEASDGEEGRHLICIVIPEDGRAFLGSYRIDGDNLEIRYPHTCICTRTGKVAVFARSKKQNPQNKAVNPSGGSGGF
jgi:hypothetical protein